MQTFDYVIILSALLALYGIWRAAKAEQNDFKKVLEISHDTRADIQALQMKQKNDSDLMSALQDRIKTLNAKVEESEKEIDQAQEHIAKLRGSYMKMREKIIPRTVVHKFPTTIPFEIMLPDKKKEPIPDRQKQFKTIKRQIDNLSK